MNKTEKTIYELLKKGVLFRDETGIYSIFPQKLLVQESGKSERTVQYALKSLEEQGYIIRELHREVNLLRIYFLKKETFAECKIIDRFENDRPPFENCTSPLESCTSPLESCTSPLENEPSPLENCTSPLENCHPLPLENDDSYTLRVGEIPPEENGIIVQKSFHPHIERSELMAKKPSYDMPDSPASHFLFDILSAGTDIADLPPRKRMFNNSTIYDVKASGDKRLVSMENYDGTTKVTVELDDINKLTKPAIMLLIYTLIKANEQALHNGQLTRDYISFPLQHLVDDGLYQDIRSARRGFLIGRDALTSLQIKGQLQKRHGSKRVVKVNDLVVPFIKGGIENNQCYIYFNTHMDWEFFAQYFTKIPKYIFSLSDRAGILLYYIFYLARQHTREIADRGYFTISFRSIQSLLKLPSEINNSKPQQYIKEPIENAVVAIEEAHKKRYGNKEFLLELVYEEQAGIEEYLDNGYLKISLAGAYAEPFISQSQTQQKKIQKAEQKKERIEEKAIAMKMAKEAKK